MAFPVKGALKHERSPSLPGHIYIRLYRDQIFGRVFCRSFSKCQQFIRCPDTRLWPFDNGSSGCNVK